MLESIVGKTFLPRGTGTVTRCPIVLQLIHSAKDDREHRSSRDGKQLYDFYDIVAVQSTEWERC